MYNHKCCTISIGKRANDSCPPFQFGFLSKCSTCTQLLDCINDWTLSVRNRHSVDVIYFDFAKAFDSVSHPKLVHKLQAYGFFLDVYLIF